MLKEIKTINVIPCHDLSKYCQSDLCTVCNWQIYTHISIRYTKDNVQINGSKTSRGVGRKG